MTTEFTIKSNGCQLTYKFDEDLLTDEMADLIKIVAICINHVDIKDGLLMLEMLRDRPPFYAYYPEEDIA
jgi:hypothetical protein